MSVREGTVKPPNWTTPWVERRKVYCKYKKEGSQRHLGESKDAVVASQGHREEQTVDGWYAERIGVAWTWAGAE